MRIKINSGRLNYAKSAATVCGRRNDSGAELFSNISYEPAASLHNSYIVRVSKSTCHRYFPHGRQRIVVRTENNVAIIAAGTRRSLSLRTLRR